MSKSIRLIAVLLICVVLLPAAGSPFRSASAAPLAATPPPLGRAKPFAVLGGSGVSNGGNSIVTGDVGVSPDTAVTGLCSGVGCPGVVNGTIHVNDTAAQDARTDVTAAYTNLVNQPDCIPTLAQLGGQTLLPGVYCLSSSAQLTGNLNLDAQNDSNAVWVFQIGSTLTTASNSSVTMLNGGKSCNVWWGVGSSATLGTGTTFKGNILALTSITLTTGVSMFGAALAGTAGAVTMDTNTIGICFGPNAIAMQEFQATSAAGFPFGAGCGRRAPGGAGADRHTTSRPGCIIIGARPVMRIFITASHHSSQESFMNNTNPQRTQERLRTSTERPATYEAPAVIYEATLEVRAGSPLGLPDPLDLFGTE